MFAQHIMRLGAALIIGLLALGASGEPSKTYISPVTGKKCVNQVDGPQDGRPQWGKFYFQAESTCSGTFIVELKLSNGKTRSNGVKPGETISLNCEFSKGECKGMTWGFR